MPIRISNGDDSGLLAMAIELTEPLYKLLFRRSHWNAIVRNALATAGSHWIWTALPRRFFDAEFDRTELGYDAEGEYVSPIARALSNGLMDTLATRFWQGWNPWRSPTVPGPLWQETVRYERAAGRMVGKPTKTWWKRLKKDLRRRVKSDLKRRVEELSAGGEVNDKQPLVNTGALRDAALEGSRSVAVATATRWSLRVIIPQPHPTHAVVGRTLRQVTDAELREMAQIINDTVHGSVEQSNPSMQPKVNHRLQLSHTADGPTMSAGPSRVAPRSLSTSQLSTFANEHRSRKLRHRSRAVA